MEKVRFKGEPIGGHAVRAAHCSKTDDVGMCAFVSLDADRSEGQKNSKGLPDLIVETEFINGLDEDFVDLTERLEPIIKRDVSQNANAEAGTWKGMTLDEALRDA